MLSVALQAGSDIVQALSSNPSYLLLFIVFTSGYAFIALGARNTRFWEKATEYEKILVGVGIGGGFAATIFFVLWGLYYSSNSGYDYTTVYYASLILSSLILVIVALHPRSTQTPEVRIRKIMSVISGTLFYASTVLFLFFVSLFFVVVAFYPASVKVATEGILVWDMIYWSLASFFGGIFYFSYSSYFYQQFKTYIIDDFPKQESLVGSEVSKFDKAVITIATRFNRLSSNRKTIAVIIIALLLMSGAVVIDYSTTAFTPKVSTSPVSPYPLSSSFYSKPVDYFLFVQNNYTQWFQNYNGPCNLTAYQLVNQNVTISIPWNNQFAVNNPVIPYPNSTDQIPENFSKLQGIAGTSYPVWQNMFVLNKSQIGISYTQLGIDLELSSSRHPSTATIQFVYFKIVKPDISCSETISYTQSSDNQNYSNTQKLNFKNNENVGAVVQIIDLPFYAAHPYSKFSIYYNGTNSRGGLVFYSFQNLLGELANTPSINYLSPGYQLNYTIAGTCNVSIDGGIQGSGSCAS